MENSNYRVTKKEKSFQDLVFNVFEGFDSRFWLGLSTAFYYIPYIKKARIRETLNLWIDGDRSINTIFFGGGRLKN